MTACGRVRIYLAARLARQRFLGLQSTSTETQSKVVFERSQRKGILGENKKRTLMLSSKPGSRSSSLLISTTKENPQ